MKSISESIDDQDLQQIWRGSWVIHFVAQVAAWIWRWNSDRLGQRPLLGRLASHAAVALLLVLFLILGSFQVDSITLASEAANLALLGGNSVPNAVDSPLASVTRPYYRGNAQARITRQIQAHTAIPDRPRLEVITYAVQSGDTAQKIAELFGLQPTTLMWSNQEMEKSPDLLRVGQVLTILPLDGVYHTVELSETLESLAEEYEVDVAAIADCSFNELSEDGVLGVGAKLIIPGGSKPYQARQVTTYEGPVPTEASGAGIFYWPSSGVLTQGYWYGHRAIDIGASVGTAIIASDGGYVSFAGWTDVGYGYLIVLDHANGYQTYYAHLSNIFVLEGESVYAGQVIGAMGNTGNSTGPHLHYEIRYNGYPTNPLIYLP